MAIGAKPGILDWLGMTDESARWHAAQLPGAHQRLAGNLLASLAGHRGNAARDALDGAGGEIARLLSED